MVLLSWTFNNINESEDGLTSSPEQEAVTHFLESVQIFAANQRNFDKNSELQSNILSSTCIVT